MFPQNGRIVIVDDLPNEAQPLMQILSKRRIPFNYYTGTDITDFPDDPNYNRFRILFLDLNIVESNKSAKDVISVLDGIFKKLVPDNPNPYLLVVWSKNNDKYGDDLKSHFDANIPIKKPAEIIFLSKSDYMDLQLGDATENKKDEWIPKSDSFEKLSSDLEAKLKELSLLRNLFAWENLVHKNACETLNDFSSFFSIDENWDKNSKAIIYRLAKAFVGDDDLSKLKDDQKLAKAFVSINSLLSEKLENDVESLCLGNVTDIQDDNVTILPSIIAKINSKLHLSETSLTNLGEQGNIYYLDDSNYRMIERIVSEKTINKGNGSKIRDSITLTKLEEVLDSEPQLIQLDITPVCDYSQDKDYTRLIYGVLLSSEFYKDYCKNPQFSCKTPLLYINGEEKFILFDFRFIKTLNKEIVEVRDNPPKFKLRKEICTDIQSQLSNQINRPGISNL